MILKSQGAQEHKFILLKVLYNIKILQIYSPTIHLIFESLPFGDRIITLVGLAYPPSQTLLACLFASVSSMFHSGVCVQILYTKYQFSMLVCSFKINRYILNRCPPCTEIFSKRRKIYSVCVENLSIACPSTWKAS